MIDLEQENRSVQTLQEKILLTEQQVKGEKDELFEAELRVSRAQRAQEVLQFLALAIQQQAHERIARVVSSCLSSVFEDPYEFQIEFERKRGKTEANLRFLRRGLSVDPLTASGGGVIDVAAFALRVACLVLHRPRLRRLVVLDEPFKFVSSQYRDNVRTMLEELAAEMEVQILMVTHLEELETGKVIRI